MPEINSLTSRASAVEVPGLAVQQAITMKRSQLHISKRELGRRCGLSAAYVSALEAGHLKPSLRSFAKLAVELRLTPQEIHLIVITEATKENA